MNHIMDMRFMRECEFNPIESWTIVENYVLFSGIHPNSSMDRPSEPL